MREDPFEIRGLHLPDGTVSSVRNALAEKATGDWLCFLDADDELAPGYVSAMASAAARLGDGRFLLTPAVAYVERGRQQPASFWPVTPLWHHNWIVIGTLIEREFFWELGGFREWGDPPGSNAYEDWALWASAEKAGAQIVKVKRAVYIAHKEEASRHRNVDGKTAVSWHREIGRELFPEHYGADWPRPPRRRVRQ